MQVVHALAPLHAVVDHDAEPLPESFVLRDSLRVRLRLRRDVAEREAQVVLVDDRRGDLLGDDLVEDGRLAAVLHALERGFDRRGALVARARHRGSQARRGGVGARVERWCERMRMRSRRALLEATGRGEGDATRGARGAHRSNGGRR
eukprot:29661-Pelagococcus_subviridis.AAC.7